MRQCINRFRVLIILICGITTLLGITRIHPSPTSTGNDWDSVPLATVVEPVDCRYLTHHIVCYENASLYRIHSVGQRHEIEICFTAFHRRFNLLLQRIEPSTVSSHKLNITVIGLFRQSRHIVDIRQYYTGHLHDEHSSFLGHLQNGVLDGEIYTATETYYVEPLERYFNSTETNRLNVVIYRERDIVLRKTHSFRSDKNIQHDSRRVNVSTFDGIMISETTVDVHLQRHRQKRVPTRTGQKACGLKIIVDYSFYKFHCDGSVMKAVNEIVYAVTAANTIFRAVDFDFDGEPDNVGFTIKEIVLHESNSSKYYLSDSRDSMTVLKAFSRYNFNGYCLGVLFTYHEFDNGILGLSWRASSSLYGRPGGICTEHSSESGMSLNALIVTAMSYRTPLPRMLLGLTFAHELGHSFGSKHDDRNIKECSPESHRGKYIMDEMMSEYSKPNKKKFSKCSLLQMSPVLFYKSHCFETLNVASLCGNYMIDPGEACDCGPRPDQCHSVDPCCVQPADTESGCRVATELGKRCSARVSACCSHDCQVDTRSTRCRDGTECAQAVFCNGVDTDCPEPVPRPDGTLCMGGMRVCLGGDCIMSRCQYHGWEDCQCLVETAEFCQLCCRNVSAQESACVPANKVSHTDNLVNLVYKTVGEMCGNGAGYCNNEHMCITEYSRACKDLEEHVFNLTHNEVFLDWLLNHWFLFLLGVTAASSFLAMLHTYTESLEPVSLMAYMSGKVIALWRLMRCEHFTLDDQLQYLESSYQWKLANLAKGCRVDVVVGIARLCHLFPTVPGSVIACVIKNSSCEELAVRWLLLRGYPMKKLPLHNSHS